MREMGSFPQMPSQLGKLASVSWSRREDGDVFSYLRGLSKSKCRRRVWLRLGSHPINREIIQHRHQRWISVILNHQWEKPLPPQVWRVGHNLTVGALSILGDQELHQYQVTKFYSDFFFVKESLGEENATQTYSSSFVLGFTKKFTHRPSNKESLTTEIKLRLRLN